MNIKNKCRQINSLLGDLSATGIKPIPSIVLEMRLLLDKIETIGNGDLVLCQDCGKNIAMDGSDFCEECGL